MDENGFRKGLLNIFTLRANNPDYTDSDFNNDITNLFKELQNENIEKENTIELKYNGEKFQTNVRIDELGLDIFELLLYIKQFVLSIGYHQDTWDEGIVNAYHEMEK